MSIRKSQMRTFAQVKKELLKDKEILAEYKKLEPEFRLIKSLFVARKKKGLTQAGLARKIGTKQSAIARLESGIHNPSLVLLRKVAKALDAQLIITIV